uniref:Thioredoxin domain-containing protein n=1 Tax=Leptocylindrus danicus TaxID=163516 RepID=A0A7S2JRQ1_9STRA
MHCIAYWCDICFVVYFFVLTIVSYVFLFFCSHNCFLCILLFIFSDPVCQDSHVTFSHINSPKAYFRSIDLKPFYSRDAEPLLWEGAPGSKLHTLPSYFFYKDGELMDEVVEYRGPGANSIIEALLTDSIDKYSNP